MNESLPFEPTQVYEVELAQPLPALPGRQRRALVLARLHSQPIGLVELSVPADGLSATALAQAIGQALGGELNAHLRADGLAEVAALSAAGLPLADTPQCLRERERLLSGAPWVSVVIATRDRADQLQVAMDSVLAQAYPGFDLIVVDNAPRTEATAELVRERYGQTPNVRYVREDRPGLAAAHNAGLAVARGEIIAFTDDDVRVDVHWLAELARGFAFAEDVACVTGLIVPAELETPAQKWLEQFGSFSKGLTLRAFNLGRHRPPDPLFPFTAGRFGSGANMAFHAATLRAWGGFDPATGTGTPALGGDDLAAFLRVIVSGQTLVYQPAALLYHRHRREYDALRRTAYGYGVGFGAFLTKAVLDHPWLLLDLLGRLPRGLRYLLSPHSAKNRNKRADYPAELNALERRGMLAGPFAYLRSRRWARRWEQRAARARTASRPVIEGAS